MHNGKKTKKDNKHADDGTIRVKKPYKKPKRKDYWKEFEEDDKTWENLWHK
jgi:hypothetical protein